MKVSRVIGALELAIISRHVRRGYCGGGERRTSGANSFEHTMLLWIRGQVILILGFTADVVTCRSTP